MYSLSMARWCEGSEVISTSVVVCASRSGISRRRNSTRFMAGDCSTGAVVAAELRSAWTGEVARPHNDSSGVHNLPSDNCRDYFSRQLPSIEGRVLRFRAGFGGVEGPLLFRIENSNVGDRAADKGP